MLSDFHSCDNVGQLSNKRNYSITSKMLYQMLSGTGCYKYLKAFLQIF
jgi:hypothetical protein